MVNINFFIDLPCPHNQCDSIWVFIDRMAKFTHFLPVRMKNFAEEYAMQYIQEIFRLHGAPISIATNRVIQFIFYFWRSFQKELSTLVDLTIQTLEDMLEIVLLTLKLFGWVTCLLLCFLTITVTTLSSNGSIQGPI